MAGVVKTDNMILEKNVTLEDVKKNIKPSSAVPTVWYSSRTAWWTDDPKDLQTSKGIIPLDIFGAPLYQGDLKKFIEAAESEPDHYGGEYGLNVLMACHHKNFKPEASETDLYDLTKNDALAIFKRAIHDKIVHDPCFQFLKNE